jgi:phospholipid/cholesterol/gamma-HCH transport system substrate-binding protein
VRRSWAAVSVGALALVLLASGYAIFMYTGERVGRDGYQVHAFFRDALGIYDRTAVRSAGIDVGRIVSKEFDPSVNRARVNLRVERGMVLYENAVVSKRAASLLGEYFLDLDPGTPVDPVTGQAQNRLEEGDEIKNVYEATDIGAITSEVGATLPILKEILHDVQELTSGPIKQIAESASSLVERNAIVLERLLQRVDNIAEQVESITRGESDDIRVAIRNIREITEGVKGLVGKSEGEVSAAGEEIRDSVQKLQSSISSLERSMGNVEKITARLESGKGTAGRLLADESIAQNLEEITEDAGSFVRSITRLQTVVGLRTEFNYLSQQFKNYVSLQIAPRPDKFYLFEIVDDFRGVREVTRTWTESSERGVVQETTVTTSLSKLRFSLMFGKRFGPLTGRLGFVESTGGVGLDLHFLNDRLSLSADLFDTRSNVYPRLRGRGHLAVYKKNLFLVAGVDDVLNQERALASGGAFFDWFFGLQLLFRDDDLKSLLLLGGGAAGAAASK